MTLPDVHTLYRVIDSTWPAAEYIHSSPFTLRRGLGGGSRVNAATRTRSTTETEIIQAAHDMRALNQRPMFMIRQGDDQLDRQLDALGYVINDPVTLYVCPIADLRAKLPHKTVFPVWPPLAAQHEIWTASGIHKPRLDVMFRANGPKTAILGRANDRPAGTVFVAMDGPIAMLHALEIHPDHRRLGLARYLTIGCANWAYDNGASHLSLVTTKANAAANALYTSLGMTVVGHYHYRIKPEP